MKRSIEETICMPTLGPDARRSERAPGKAVLAWLLALVLALAGLALAQTQEPVEPVDPVGEGTAMVRFVNLSPNADPAQISLTNSDGAVVSLMGLDDLPYGEASSYLPVPAGSYDLTVTVGAADGGDLPLGVAQPFVGSAPQGTTFSDDGRYTVALIGLIVPESFDDDGNDTGFWGWLRNLFGSDAANRDALALRIEVLTDDAATDFPAEEARVRVVHAAPGLAPIDLVASGDRGVVVGNLVFGETSGYQTLAASETLLELRASDSQVVLLDLSDDPVDVGSVHTVFVIGTPVEDMPVDALVFADGR